MKTNLAKSNAFLLFFIKSLVIFLSFWFIYQEVMISRDLSEFKNIMSDGLYSPAFYFLFPLFFVLFLLNWAAEAFKWKIITQKHQKISFFDACKAVCSGVTIGLFTPNRIGEYGGRILYLERNKRIDAVISGVTGNFSQFLITLVFGISGIILYLRYYSRSFFESYYHLLFLVIPLFFFLFLNLNKIPFLFRGKAANYLKAFTLYGRKDLLKLIILSSFRYLFFFFQFYLLLLIFKIELYLTEAIVLLPVVFLAITLIPSFALAEWGVRGSAAVYFIGAVSSNSAGILTAATVLWIFNIALPALLGAVFIVKYKLS
jgi:uncharacterized membrane protein YbhN (UPF0104 family)